MENASNKKRTAVVASAVAAALLLSGTFAWNMATDQTKLNEFQASDPGDYNVELNENFDPSDPWANKDVYVTNISDNPVIVRVRLEEFYNLLYRNGTEYNTPEGFTNGDADGSAIFNVPAGSTLTGTDADSSTKLDQFVIMHFGEGVVSMADWIAQGKPYADSNGNAYWVIDEDGWCYYTKALSATESTSYLLDDVDFVKSSFEAIYDSPYTLDYYINVRLQAMSADLADFGSDTDTAQWTNIGTNNDGRIIAGTENAYELTADQTISDSARALVLGIENPDKSVGKAVATAADLKAVLADDDTLLVTLSDDIDVTDEVITVPQDKTLDLNGKTVTTNSGVYLMKNAVLKNGTITTSADDTVNYSVQIRMGGKATLDGVTINHLKDSGTAISPLMSSNVTLNNCTINSEYECVTPAATNTTININNSTLNGKDTGVFARYNTNLTISNSEVFGGLYGIAENNTQPAKKVVISDSTIKSLISGYTKLSNSELVMTNTKIEVAGAGTSAYPDENPVGIVIRCGKVTLDNVDVQVAKNEGDPELNDPSSIDQFYTTTSNGFNGRYEPLQLILNSYGDVDLTIKNGCSFSTIAEANSVYVCESGKNITGSDTFTNIINVSSDTEYTPAFAFADSYLNTTVNK